MAVLSRPAGLALLKVAVPEPMLEMRVAELAKENEDTRFHGSDRTADPVRLRVAQTVWSARSGSPSARTAPNTANPTLSSPANALVNCAAVNSVIVSLLPGAAA